MELRERILMISKFYNLSVREFEKVCQLGRGNISNMKGTIGTDKLSKIIDTFPSINALWLISGEGEMFVDLQNQKKIEMAEKVDRIPFYKLTDQVGLQELFSGSIEPESYISIPGISAVDGAVNIRGQAMYPLLQPGDIVLYKILNNPHHVILGEMYLLSLTINDQQYTTVRYIHRTDKGVRLSGHNTASGVIEVNDSEITAIALIKANIRFNTML